MSVSPWLADGKLWVWARAAASRPLRSCPFQHNLSCRVRETTGRCPSMVLELSGKGTIARPWVTASTMTQMTTELQKLANILVPQTVMRRRQTLWWLD